MFPENMLTQEAKNQLMNFKEIAKTVDRENLVYRTYEYRYSL